MLLRANFSHDFSYLVTAWAGLRFVGDASGLTLTSARVLARDVSAKRGAMAIVECVEQPTDCEVWLDGSVASVAPTHSNALAAVVEAYQVRA